jgi:cation diffusion facilitator CzcD-associated flavoprotein CzcO
LNVAEAGLKALEERLRWELEVLKYPHRPWVLRPEQLPPAQAEEYDVVIVGGGQSGLALSFALQREGITRVLVVESSAPGKAGPWTTFARMPTLRTPKHLTGPDSGIPSLTPRAWFEARYGAEAWAELRYIPLHDWVAYLAWYERVLALPVRHETSVGAITWDEHKGVFQLPLAGKGLGSVVYGRKVVLATGIDGAGQWQVPESISSAVPKDRYHHTNEDIDFSLLSGKTIAVLGAGASAFDNAIMACRHGAAKVDLFFRRPELVKVNPYRWAEFVGFLKHHTDLPDDDDKWAFMHHMVRVGQLPPPDTLHAAEACAQFSMHPGSRWDELALKDGRISIATNRGEYQCDHIIVGTGFVTDLQLRPELAELYPSIALWKDRFSPSTAPVDDLLRHPYLTSGFSFSEKIPGTAPYLRSLFNYNFGSFLSNGYGGATITGMKYSLRRLVDEITKQFYVDAKTQYLRSLQDYREQDKGMP